MKKLNLIAICALFTGHTAIFAHENTGHGTAHASPSATVQMPWGVAGQAAAATRTIELAMDDHKRFTVTP